MAIVAAKMSIAAPMANSSSSAALLSIPYTACMTHLITLSYTVSHNGISTGGATML